jgi:wyosine [tRNA(Phe)-imidazoG37] synthetase (radical SAM superfamily)
MGELLDRIKTMTDVPVAVLTNASLLWQPEVRRELHVADLVVPSLDAGDEPTFRRVNRPHDDISFDRMIEGLLKFREEFPGAYWLEVLLLANLTDNDRQIDSLVQWVERIGPERVQLNTVTRPPAESCAQPVPDEHMRRLAARFHPPAEVIGKFRRATVRCETTARRDDVLELLHRRPCTLENIAHGLAMPPSEVVKYVEDLCAEQLLRRKRIGNELYFEANPQ